RVPRPLGKPSPLNLSLLEHPMNIFTTRTPQAGAPRSLTPPFALSSALAGAGCGPKADDGAGDCGEVSELNAERTATTSSSTDGSSSSDSTDTSTSGTTDGTTGSTTDTSGGSGFVASDMGAGCGTMCNIWMDDCPEDEKCTSVACEIGSNSWDS